MMRRLLRQILALVCTALLLLTSASALTVDQALTLLDELYVNPIPEEARQAQSLDELLEILGDPYTEYMTAEEYQQFLRDVEQNTSFVGVGLELTLAEEGANVVSVIAGSGAEAAGLRPGDVLLEIEGESCAGFTLDDLSGALMGEEGTYVSVTVRRGEEQLSFRIRRQPVEVHNTTATVLDGGIGYLDCRSFGQDTGDYVREGLETYDGDVHIWMLDLRSNTGGVTTAAVETAGAFTGGGILLRMRDKDGRYAYGWYGEDPSTEQNLILLTDSYTASASEIVASAIRDTRRGISVGTRTYGKGVAQSVLDETNSPYFDGDAFKITSDRFYSADGNTTDAIGVIPTLLVIPSDTEAVALLLCEEDPGEEHCDGWLRLRLVGHDFYVNAAAAAEESAVTLRALLGALAPDVELSLGTAEGWTDITTAQAVELFDAAGDSRWFTDVADSPYADAINTLATYDILRGSGSGAFYPEDTITRAEVCSMLAQALGIYTSGGNPFTDVTSQWYASAVGDMARMGFVEGVGGGRFAPEETMSCQQFITIMGRLAAFLNTEAYEFSQDPPVLDAGVPGGYASWAVDSLLLLTDFVMDENSSAVSLLESLDPEAPILREEAAAILYHVLTGLGLLVY